MVRSTQKMVFVLFAIVETELGVVHSALERDTIKTSRSLNGLRVYLLLTL